MPRIPGSGDPKMPAGDSSFEGNPSAWVRVCWKDAKGVVRRGKPCMRVLGEGTVSKFKSSLGDEYFLEDVADDDPEIPKTQQGK